jgi:hypothetical protein
MINTANTLFQQWNNKRDLGPFFIDNNLNIMYNIYILVKHRSITWQQ